MRRIFGGEVATSDAFHVFCDASRLSPDAIVDLLVGAGAGAPTGFADTELVPNVPEYL